MGALGALWIVRTVREGARWARLIRLLGLHQHSASVETAVIEFQRNRIEQRRPSSRLPISGRVQGYISTSGSRGISLSAVNAFTELALSLSSGGPAPKACRPRNAFYIISQLFIGIRSLSIQYGAIRFVIRQRSSARV